MNLLIIGCGRVGANLAEKMCDRGHDVAVIDRKKTAFELLDEGFTGLTFEGVPIDNETLLGAGITSCDALCAVTDDDNINLTVAQIAKDIYHVPTVLVRILDPDKDDVFQEFGLSTVCPTKLTTEALVSALDGYQDEQNLHYGNHTVKFFSIPVPENFIGAKSGDIQLEENETLFAILSEDSHFRQVLSGDIILREGDKLIFSKLVD